MDKIYYQPNHLRKGQKAVKKLKEYSKEKPKVIKQWLSRQAARQPELEEAPLTKRQLKHRRNKDSISSS